MRKWLRAANRWQRLWFVASVFLIAYATLLWPLKQAGEIARVNWSFENAIENDFRNPACLPYQTQPLGSLKEPQLSFDGGNCYEIYRNRKSDTTTPYTLEAYRQKRSDEYRENYLIALAIGAVSSVLLIALVYGLGSLLRWIIYGFKQSP